MYHLPVIRQMKLREDFEFDLNQRPHKLPTYLDGGIEVFDMNVNRRDCARWFFRVLDELQKEYEEEARQLLPSGFFFLDFFLGIGPCGPVPPPSPRVEFHSASSYCCVNYT